MVNYFYDKYDVIYNPWSAEEITYGNIRIGGTTIFLWENVIWDGNKYVGVGASGYYPIGTSGWQIENGYQTSYRRYLSGGDGSLYYRTGYVRNRLTFRGELLQPGIVGTSDEYPSNGFYSDGFWYVRKGLVNAPIITSPNGGETIDDIFTITFTDSEPNQGIRYNIQLSVTNGITWGDIVALTDVGATSHTYNFAFQSDTSTAKLRIRAYDGVAFGAWDESDGVFTIRHNTPPTAPTRLSPRSTILDRNKTHAFTWKHNDFELQSKADLEWRAQGTSTWTTYTSNGPDEVYYIAGSTFPNGQIEWRVRTYDQRGLVSPYAAISVFTVAEPSSAPTIIQPDSLVNVPRPTVEWISGAQASYQIIVVDSVGATYWDSGEKTSSNKAQTIGVDLLNGATYTVKVRIKDGGGLFSSFSEKTITVSTTSPAKPIVSVFASDGYIAFDIESPVPSGLQPAVTSHEIYKRVDDEWVRIALGINSVFNDYRVKHDTIYEYYVKAIGSNGTSSNSEVISQSVKIDGSWIYAVQDPEATLQKFRYNGTGYKTSYEPESSVMKFAGRKRPVVHFGDYEDYSLTLKIQAVEGMDDMDVLRRFVSGRETVCYRDKDGHMIVGNILSLDIDKEYRVSSAVITIIETDFSEEV